MWKAFKETAFIWFFCLLVYIFALAVRVNITRGYAAEGISCLARQPELYVLLWKDGNTALFDGGGVKRFVVTDTRDLTVNDYYEVKSRFSLSLKEGIGRKYQLVEIGRPVS